MHDKHGGQCSCGHEHNHDHGEQCSCGHDHDHPAHQHEPAHVGGFPCTLREHEGALVLQTAWQKHEAEDEARGSLANAILDIGNRVKAAGGLIGHIKATVTGHASGTMLSMTDDRVNQTSFVSESVQIQLTVIVYAVEQDALREIVCGAVGAHCGVSIG